MITDGKVCRKTISRTIITVCVKYYRVLMRNNQQLHIEISRLYITISAGPYLLPTSIVAIFRKVFFEGILHGSSKQDGHNRWPKHVGGYTQCNIKYLHNCLSTCWLFLIRNRQCMVMNLLKLLSGVLLKRTKLIDGGTRKDRREFSPQTSRTNLLFPLLSRGPIFLRSTKDNSMSPLTGKGR